MLNKIVRLGLALSLLIPVLPQPAQAAEQQTASWMVKYDLDATSMTFCRVTGKNGSPWGGPMEGPAPIKTTGSSATTAAVTASTSPFASVVAGDILVYDPGTGSANVLFRTIISKASDDSVTVDSAWNIGSSTPFGFLKQTCGTTATDGWIDVGGWDTLAMTFQMDQVNVTGGIDVQIQCKADGLGAQPVQVFPTCTSGSCNSVQNYVTAGIASRTTVVATEPWSQCRMGVLIHTNDDGDDTGANAEQLYGMVMGSRVSRSR